MTNLRSLYYWTIGLGYFGPILIVLIIRSFFQTPHDYDNWLRRRLNFLFNLLNSSPNIEFAEALPTDKPLIFMSNHSSLIDVPLLKAIIPQYFVGVLAHHQLNYFLYGPAVTRMGSIAIDRTNVRQSLRSFEQAKELINQGINITVLPEGGRSLDGRLLPFKKLPFRFAKESGASIVPISISGVFKMKNKGSLQLRPGRLVARFGAIITADKIAKLDINELMDMTHERIQGGLEPFETRPH
mgnify:CR=1 FL=1